MTTAQIVLSAVDKTKAAVDGAKRNLQSLGDTAGALPARFGTLGVAIAAAFTAVSTKGAIDTLDRLDDLSEKTGIAVESLSLLRYAGEVTGTPLEAIAQGTKKLAVNMAEAAGGNKEAAATFKALGVEVKNQDGTLRSQDAVLLDLADRFAGYKDGAEKSAAAARIFGERAGGEMIPLLNQGSAGIRALRSEAEALGAVYGGDLAKEAANFNDNLKRLELNAEAAKVSIVGGLLPALNSLLQKAIELAQVKGGIWGWLTSTETAADLDRPGQKIGEIQQQLESVRKQRQEIEGSIANKGPLRYLPLFGTAGDLHTLDVQEQKLKEQLEFYKELDAVRRRTLNPEAARLEAAFWGGAGKTAAPVIPSGASGSKADKEAKERERELKERAKLLAELSGLSGSFSEDWARLNELFKSGAISLDQLVAMQGKLLDQQPFMRERVESERALVETRQQAQALADKSLAQMVQENDELVRSNQTLGEQIEAIGLTAKEMRALTMARLEHALQLERERLLMAQNIEGNEAEVAQIERRIKLLERQKELTGEQFDREASTQFSEGLRDDLRGALQRAFEDSKNPMKAFVEAFASTLYTRISSKLADAILDAVLGSGIKGGGGGDFFSSLLGAILPGFGGGGGVPPNPFFANAMGNVFQSPGLSRYSSSIVNQPTVFAFAKGAGLMGEAGPEAIMPLRRGRDGRLGVDAAPSAGRSLTVNNYLTVGDVASMQQVQEQLRASERRTLAALARANKYGRG